MVTQDLAIAAQRPSSAWGGGHRRAPVRRRLRRGFRDAAAELDRRRPLHLRGAMDRIAMVVAGPRGAITTPGCRT